jgi:hypothetical protein
MERFGSEVRTLQVATADEWLAITLVHAEGRYVRPAEILSGAGRLEDGRPASAGRRPRS